jgi:acetyl esterase
MAIDCGDECIPVRVYRPDAKGILPIMVYFHGGGWCYGSIASHDAVCRSYTASLGAVVVSVQYRLAPEHPFPAGLQDCYAATCWVSLLHAQHSHILCL